MYDFGKFTYLGQPRIIKHCHVYMTSLENVVALPLQL
jgi:hypothetical protein